MSTPKYPKSKATVRVFRLWNANRKKALQWRYYKHRDNAKLGALIEAKNSTVGTTIEVFNSSTGKELGQYTRRPHAVTFSEQS
jgi:hypothetical protein